MTKKKKIVSALMLVCLLLSSIPITVQAAGNRTVSVGESITIWSHGSWNADSGLYHWEVEDESILASVPKGYHAESIVLTGISPGSTTLTLYYQELKNDVIYNRTDQWTITVTTDTGVTTGTTIATDVESELTVIEGTVSENVAGTITDIKQYSGYVDLVPVKRNGLWGYANSNMELVIPFQFDTADSFDAFGSQKYTTVTVNGNQYVIDTKGNYATTDQHKFFTVHGDYFRGYDTVRYSGPGTSWSVGGDFYKDGIKISEAEYEAGVNAYEKLRNHHYLRYAIGERGKDSFTMYFYWEEDAYADGYALTLTTLPNLASPNASWIEHSQIMVEGLLIVHEDTTYGKYGVIDSTGKLVFPLEYDEIFYSSGGYLAYKKGNECGLLENTINPPVKKPANSQITLMPTATPSSTSIPTSMTIPSPTADPTLTPTLTAVPTPTATALPTPALTAVPTPALSSTPGISANSSPKAGDKITDLIDYRREPSCGLTAVKVNEKWGYVDENDILVIPCKYKCAYRFSEDSELAVVKVSSKKENIIDLLGNKILKKNYNEVFSPWKQAICVRNGSQKKGWTYYYFDIEGNSITKEEYENAPKTSSRPIVGHKVTDLIDSRSSFSACGLTAVKIDGKWGYVNENDVLVIPCKFHYVYTFNERSKMAVVELSNGKENVIDLQGELILKKNYDEAYTPFKSAIRTRNGSAKKGWTYYYFDIKGSSITEEEYKNLPDLEP